MANVQLQHGVSLSVAQTYKGLMRSFRTAPRSPPSLQQRFRQPQVERNRIRVRPAFYGESGKRLGLPQVLCPSVLQRLGSAGLTPP
jgi:hypothetical protein